MYLERLKGKWNRLLKELTDESLIFELKTGKTFGGRLEEYDGRDFVELYSCQRLDMKNFRWVDSDRNIEHGHARFWLSDIRNIFHLPEAQSDAIRELEDILQIHINPYYKPMMGIQCDWGLGKNWSGHRHQPECDFRLHEALAFISTYPDLHSGSRRNKWQSRQFEDSFSYVRRRLIMYGAEIP